MPPAAQRGRPRPALRVAPFPASRDARDAQHHHRAPPGWEHFCTQTSLQPTTAFNCSPKDVTAVKEQYLTRADTHLLQRVEKGAPLGGEGLNG